MKDDVRSRTAGPLTISQFAARSGLSVKALRLYDLSGLLPPRRTDQDTGYRFYDEAQLDRARRISLLRQLEMPLAQVTDTLAGTDTDALRALDEWWATQEAGRARKQSVLRYLRGQLRSGGGESPADYPVLTRELSETKVASIRRDTDQPNLVATMIACDREIQAHLAAAGGSPSGPLWTIYHGLVTPDGEGTIEVCVPFTGAIEPIADITIRLEPAQEQVYCTVPKRDCFYPKIMRAYELVAAHIATTGLRCLGSPREIYLGDVGAMADDAPAAHIAQPVERTPA